MLGGLLRCDGDHRHVQASTDDLRNRSDWYALLGNRVIPGASFCFLQREPIQTGGIEAVSRRPAVEPIADVCRNALFAGDLDRIGNKALLHRVMDLGKADDGNANAATSGRGNRLLRAPRGPPAN